MNLYKFTPDMMDPSLLKDLSVGRESLISDLAERFKEHAEKRVPFHLLFVGPRGIGKTHLLLLIYHKILDTPELSEKLIPIKLSEEEYSITDISDLFRRIMEELNLGEQGSYQETLKIFDKESFTDKVIDVLDSLAKERMPVLFIDNLQLVFGQLSQGDLKKLRSILQEHNNISIIGAASSVFSQITNYGEPFYNFFELRFLDDWTEDEIEEFIKRKLKTEGREEILKEFGKYRQKIKAITVLTGGNPRLVITLCEILCSPEKIADIEKTLLSLLDELTPFYQARMEELSPQPRKIFDTLSISDGPLTPTEIARSTGYEVNTVNVQLRRLQEIGFVETVKFRRKRGVHYEVKERLFRIWREMRFPLGRKRIGLFVNFLRLWYSRDSLVREYKELLHIIDREQKCSSDEVRRLVDDMWYLQEAIGAPRKYNLIIDRFLSLISTGNITASENEISALKDLGKKDVGALYLSLDLEAFLLYSRCEFEKSVAVAQKSLQFDSNRFIALLSMAWSLHGLKRFEEALKYADRMINSSNLMIKLLGLEVKGTSLLALEKPTEALASVNEALRILPKKFPKHWLISLKADALFFLGQPGEALECLDQIQLREVDKSKARAILFKKAVVFLRLGRKEMFEKKANEFIVAEQDSEESRMLRILLYMEKNEFGEAERAARTEIDKSTDRDSKQSFSLLLLLTFTRWSEQLLKDGKTERAKALFVDAIQLKENVESRHFRDWLFGYFDRILPLERFDVILEVYSLVDQKLDEMDKQTIAPIIKAAEYVTTRNVDILEKLQKETRQIVVSIVKKYSPQTSLPRQL